MSRSKTQILNTDRMFSGCTNFDATELKFSVLSPYVSSMDYMFYGAGVNGSTALDNENIKFNNLVSCKSSFEESGFGFKNTFMQFYGKAIDGKHVDSISKLFMGNKRLADEAPTIILSRADDLTSASVIDERLDNRFSDVLSSGNATSDIYNSTNGTNGIHDFSYLYADTSIKSADIRGICNNLAASSVLESDYVKTETEYVYLSSYSPSSAVGSSVLVDFTDTDVNAIAISGIPQSSKDYANELFTRYRCTVASEGSTPHIRKFVKIVDTSSRFANKKVKVVFDFRIDGNGFHQNIGGIELRVVNGVTDEGQSSESYNYISFTVDGTSNSSSYRVVGDGWHSAKFEVDSFSDARIVLWISPQSKFDTFYLANVRIDSESAVVTYGKLFTTTSEYGNYMLYVDYQSSGIGTLNFSNMFENCANLETIYGFVPQYGSTYHAMFNNCSSMDIDLSTFFKNYYTEDEEIDECYLSSVTVCGFDGTTVEGDDGAYWNNDRAKLFNGFDTIRFHNGVAPAGGGAFNDVRTFFALVDKYGNPFRFKDNERIRISFHAFDDRPPNMDQHGTRYFHCFVGDRPYGSDGPWAFDSNRPFFRSEFPQTNGWAHRVGEFRTGVLPRGGAYGGPIIIGMRGNIPRDGNFWLGNLAIDAGRYHIRCGYFGDRAFIGNRYRFSYRPMREQENVYKPAYNTLPCIEGYCPSSISYMFNGCESVHADNDSFDLVSLVRCTAETLERLGYDPSTMRSSFEHAFPPFNIVMNSAIEGLTTVNYDTSNVSKNYGLMRYCSYNNGDEEKYGLGTNYMKWLFASGFLRYGGMFMNNDKYFFLIPYYPIVNEDGEIIDLQPHVSRKERSLKPEGFNGIYNRSACFISHSDFMSNARNPFLGGLTNECATHRTYNWTGPSQVLFGAYIYDLDGNFVKKAYVGEWIEYVYMNGHWSTSSQGYSLTKDFTTTAHRSNPVTIFQGTMSVGIPDVGTIKTRVDDISKLDVTRLTSLGFAIDSYSGITNTETKTVTNYVWCWFGKDRWWPCARSSSSTRTWTEY